MSTTLLIRSQTGKSATGTASLAPVDPSTRGLKAALFAAAGIAGAAALIWIPIVHLITTWLLPVIGIALAWRTWTTQATFAAVSAACPECGGALEWTDRGARFPIREACPSCSTQLEVNTTGA